MVNFFILTFFGIQLVGIQKVNAEAIQISTNDIYVAGNYKEFRQDYVDLDSHWMAFSLNDYRHEITNLLLRFGYRFPISNARYNVTFTIASFRDIVPAAYLNGKACQPFYSRYVNSADIYSHLVSYSCVDLDGFTNSFELNFKGQIQGTDLFMINHQFYINRFDDSSSAVNGSLNNINDSINSTNSKLDEVNGTLNNSDTSGSQSELENVNDKFKDDISKSPISDLVNLPLKLLTSFNNKLSSNQACTPYDMGTIFGVHWLRLPCINPSDYLGSVLWATIDMISTALLLWAIAHKMVKVYISISTVDGQFVTKIISQTGGML